MRDYESLLKAGSATSLWLLVLLLSGWYSQNNFKDGHGKGYDLNVGTTKSTPPLSKREVIKILEEM